MDVEAVQFDGTNGGDICKWMRSNGQLKVYESRDVEGRFIVIDTREGTMRADEGDFVICEPHPTDDRRFYPAKEHIFRHGYEEIRDVIPPDDTMRCDICNAPRREHTRQGWSIDDDGRRHLYENKDAE